MGNKFMKRMVTLVVALAMIMTSGVFVFAESSPTVGKVSKVSSEGASSVKYLKVSWKNSGNADQYIVKITRTDNGETITYKAKGSETSHKFTTVAGKIYKVSVTPVYKGKNGKAVKGKTRWMKRTTITSVKAAGSKKLTVKWKKTKGATGYQILVYKNGKWTTVKKVGKVTKATVKMPAKGTYKIKVRPMKGSKKNIYGVRSAPKSGKAK